MDFKCSVAGTKIRNGKFVIAGFAIATVENLKECVTMSIGFVDKYARNYCIDVTFALINNFKIPPFKMLRGIFLPLVVRRISLFLEIVNQ